MRHWMTLLILLSMTSLTTSSSALKLNGQTPEGLFKVHLDYGEWPIKACGILARDEWHANLSDDKETDCGFEALYRAGYSFGDQWSLPIGTELLIRDPFTLSEKEDAVQPPAADPALLTAVSQLSDKVDALSKALGDSGAAVHTDRREFANAIEALKSSLAAFQNMHGGGGELPRSYLVIGGMVLLVLLLIIVALIIAFTHNSRWHYARFNKRIKVIQSDAARMVASAELRVDSIEGKLLFAQEELAAKDVLLRNSWRQQGLLHDENRELRERIAQFTGRSKAA